MFLRNKKEINKEKSSDDKSQPTDSEKELTLDGVLLELHSLVMEGAESGDPPGDDSSVGSQESEASAYCPVCETVVSEETDGVCCNLCSKWYHYDVECSGLGQEYRNLVKHKNIWFICTKCNDKTPIEKLKGKEANIEDVHKSIMMVNNKIENYNQIVAMMTVDVSEKITAMENEMKTLRQNVEEVKKQEKTL